MKKSENAALRHNPIFLHENSILCQVVCTRTPTRPMPPPPPRGVVAASRPAEAPPLQRLAPSPSPAASGGGGNLVWLWLQSRGCWRWSPGVAAHEAALPPCPPSRLKRAGGVRGGDTPLFRLAGAAVGRLFSASLSLRYARPPASPPLAIWVAPLSPRGFCVVGCPIVPRKVLRG